ncbi:MAG: MFS transporter [Treponema sp.]|nr:MFS transporter [Treponema sp.]
MLTLLLVIIYIAFISLGLPDSVLGAAWPSMFEQLGVPVGYAGIITMIIAGTTILSSLSSNFLNRKLGTGHVMVISVAVTAAALFGFSVSSKFWHLCLIGIPYGLGAGNVDASLNNYVALHYKPRHMSWLHCFWGVGTMIGPAVMSAFIAGGGVWTQGYRAISIFQMILTAVLLASLPLWKKAEKAEDESGRCGEPSLSLTNEFPSETRCADENTVSSSLPADEEEAPVTLKTAIKIPGVLFAILAFLCYCIVEATTGFWATTYMVFYRGIEINLATSWAMLFYVGITAGRFISGFVSEKLGDKNMIRSGSAIVLLALALMALPFGGKWLVFAALILAGFGCAPIFPCMIHATPDRFGKKNSQAVIGLQMACAYTGSTFGPPLFGLIVQKISVFWLPFYGMIFALLLIVLSELLNRRQRLSASGQIGQQSC